MADTKISALATLAAASIAAGDWVPVVDASDTTMAASGTTKKSPANDWAQCTKSNTFSARQMFSASVGLFGTKGAVTGGAATALCDIALVSGTVSAVYLVSVFVNGTGKIATGAYLVTQAYADADIAELVKSLYSFSGLTMTVAADAANRKVTLTITVAGGDATNVYVSVLPLLTSGGSVEATLTML